METLESVKMTDAREVRRQIDSIIDKPIHAHYTFDQSSFKHIEKTVNFALKLE